MSHYRITFEDRGGHTVAMREFDAEGDREALSLGKTLLPSMTYGYQLWRENGSFHRPLIFAEWTFPPVPRKR